MKNNKFLNFLYYNKLKIICLIILAVLIVLAFKDCGNRTKKDFGLLYVSDVEKADIGKIEKALKDSGIIEDADGEDGVNIQITTIYIPESVEVMKQQRIHEQLQAELSVGECALYILDEETIFENEHLEIFQDLTDLADKYDVPEDKRYMDSHGRVCAISLEGNRFLKENGAPCDTLYLALRYHDRGTKDKTLINADKAAEYILKNK